MKSEYSRILGLNSLQSLYECKSGYLDAEDCSWYHSNWLLLRYLGMVSNPYWHEDFFHSAIKVFLDCQSSLLVLGTADFSMPLVCQDAGIKKIEVFDICKTPLNICKNVSDYHNYGWKITQGDVFCGLDCQHDAVVNDAFLTRFPYDKKRVVLRAIHENLKDNGVYITTIRHEWNDGSALVPSESEKDDFINRTIQAANNYNLEIKRAECAALQYINRMISFPIRDKAMLEDLTVGLFEIEQFEVAAVPGECKPSEYYHVVLRKI